MCARVDQLTLFPYNRGWSSTQVRRDLYTHYKDSLAHVETQLEDITLQ